MRNSSNTMAWSKILITLLPFELLTQLLFTGVRSCVTLATPERKTSPLCGNLFPLKRTVSYRKQ